MADEKKKKKKGEGDGEPEPPSYTLRCDNAFDITAMVTIVALAEGLGMKLTDPARLAEMQAKVREFELYEEKFLRAAIQRIAGQE